MSEPENDVVDDNDAPLDPVDPATVPEPEGDREAANHDSNSG